MLLFILSDISYLGLSDLTGITASAPEEQTEAERCKVAFSAVAAVGSLGDMRPYERIIFETVYTNVGDGYDRNSGTFTV